MICMIWYDMIWYDMWLCSTPNKPSPNIPKMVSPDVYPHIRPVLGRLRVSWRLTRMMPNGRWSRDTQGFCRTETRPLGHHLMGKTTETNFDEVIEVAPCSGDPSIFFLGFTSCAQVWMRLCGGWQWHADAHCGRQGRGGGIPRLRQELVICWELVGQGRKDEKRTPRKPQWWFCEKFWVMIFIWYLYDTFCHCWFVFSNWIPAVRWRSIGPLQRATAWSKIVRMQSDISSDFLGRDNPWMFITCIMIEPPNICIKLHKWIQRYSCYITSYTFWNHLDCINPHK